MSTTLGLRLLLLVCIYYPWSVSTTIGLCLLPVVYVYYHCSVPTTLGLRLLLLVEALGALLGLAYAVEFF